MKSTNCLTLQYVSTLRASHASCESASDDTLYGRGGQSASRTKSSPSSLAALEEDALQCSTYTGREGDCEEVDYQQIPQ